jgi:hypothetical protein
LPKATVALSGTHHAVEAVLREYPHIVGSRVERAIAGPIEIAARLASEDESASVNVDARRTEIASLVD